MSSVVADIGKMYMKKKVCRNTPPSVRESYINSARARSFTIDLNLLNQFCITEMLLASQ
jgi:hypothetical protein